MIAAVWCTRSAPSDGWLGPATIVFAVMTGIALLLLAGVARHGVGRWHEVPGTVPDADTDAARWRFVGLATALLAGLAVLAIGYLGLAWAIAGSCR